MGKIIAFFQTPLSAVIAVALLGILVILLGVMWEVVSKRKNLFQNTTERKSIKEQYSSLLNKSSFIRRSEEQLDKRLAVLRVNYTARDITDIRMLCVVVAAAAAILLKNWMLFAPLAILGWQIPLSVVERKVQKRLDLFESQLLDAMKNFLTEFATLGNAQQAFIKVCPRIEYPLRYEFEYISRRLNSGEYPREIFEDFTERTQNRWTMLFSTLMIFHFEEGAEVQDQILQIMEQLSSDKIMRDKTRTEVSAVRNLNLFLNAIIPFVYLTDRIINPTASAVYTNSPTGRLILVGVAVLSLTSLWLGKRLSK